MRSSVSGVSLEFSGAVLSCGDEEINEDYDDWDSTIDYSGAPNRMNGTGISNLLPL